MVSGRTSGLLPTPTVLGLWAPLLELWVVVPEACVVAGMDETWFWIDGADVLLELSNCVLMKAGTPSALFDTDADDAPPEGAEVTAGVEAPEDRSLAMYQYVGS